MGALQDKNKFVLELRDYLKLRYHTDKSLTFGEGEFEGKKKGDVYLLVRKNPQIPNDILGFCFRKDLCFRSSGSELDVLKEVYEFVLRGKNINGVFDRNQGTLKLEFGDRQYFVSANIDDGYAGEINVSFMELPKFVLKAV